MSAKNAEWFVINIDRYINEQKRIFGTESTQSTLKSLEVLSRSITMSGLPLTTYRCLPVQPGPRDPKVFVPPHKISEPTLLSKRRKHGKTRASVPSTDKLKKEEFKRRKQGKATGDTQDCVVVQKVSRVNLRQKNDEPNNTQESVLSCQSSLDPRLSWSAKDLLDDVAEAYDTWHDVPII